MLREIQPPPDLRDLPPEVTNPAEPSPLGVDNSAGGWSDAAADIVAQTGTLGLSLLLIAAVAWTSITAYVKLKGNRIKANVDQAGSLVGVNAGLMEMVKEVTEAQQVRIENLEERAQVDKNTIVFLRKEIERLQGVTDGKLLGVKPKDERNGHDKE